MNKAQKLMLPAILSLAAALTFLSCSSEDGGEDPADKGNDIGNYETVKIGSQTWMAENLNYNVEGSKCYDDDPSNCDKYGRLYTWDMAKTACPAGWHLPTNAEWDALYKYADSGYEVEAGYSETAGKHLKAADGWNEGGNGLDTHGFAALPGGLGISGGIFIHAGSYGYWWSASESGGDYPYYRVMGDYDLASWSGSNKMDLRSVRCVKD